MYRKDLHIHFLGIGGIGMSGIAKILKTQGYRVSGCDLDLQQATVTELIAMGCDISNQHNSELCQDQSIDILVYSSAVANNNPEVLLAKERNIPIIPRALMLAELMRTKFGIAIAGAHGKTTTTSLVSNILIDASLSPTVIIGGRLKRISTNAQWGDGDFLVAEADESDKSLLHLQATIALITNIDLEHLETYQNLDEIKDTFVRFLNNLPFYGKAILCLDCPNIRSILPISHIKTITYGIKSNESPLDQNDRSNHPLPEIYATDVILEANYSTFNVWRHNQPLGQIKINMPGRHNVLNALGAITVALELAIDFSVIHESLKDFGGIERRFSYHGATNSGAEVFDDYGHHPAEIQQTLLVAKKRTHGKLIVVFQPHRFSRTHKLWNDFIDLFSQNQVDQLIITDIYPASEKPIDGVSSQLLVAAVKLKSPNLNITYLPISADFDLIIKEINQNTHNQDLILLLGAGKINQIAKLITL